MAESVGFYPTEEQEPDFEPIFTNKQLQMRYENVKNWYRINYWGTSKLYKLVFGNSSDIKKVQKMLEQQNFRTKQRLVK